MSNRFDYVKYDNAAIVDQEEAKAKVQELEHLIDQIGCAEFDPPILSKECARAKALANTKLEECYMWIGKAIRDAQIARIGSAPLQEERTNS